MNSHIKFFAATLVVFIAASLALDGALAAPPTRVTVSEVNPNSALQGEGLTVTISGDGFDDQSTVRFLVAGTNDDDQVVTTGPAVLDESENLVVPIQVLGTATVDLYDVEVRNSRGRRGKGTDLFRVQESTGGNGGDQSNTPLKVTFNQTVGEDKVPSSLVHDDEGPLYVHKENVDALSKSGTYWSGILMDFPGLKWRGGRGRQLYFEFVCDDSTALGGECSALETLGAIEPTGNGTEVRALMNILQFAIYQDDECPLPNPDCPSAGIFDMIPGSSEMVALSAIVKSSNPFILLQSNPTIPGDCIHLLSPANQQLFMDSCLENGAPPGSPFCNTILTAYDLDPGAGNGNDLWTIEAEEAVGLLCTSEQFIGVMTLSLDVFVERRD